MAFSLAVVALLLFFFGTVLGLRVGAELAPRCVTRHEYWMANLGVLGVGVVVSAVVWVSGLLLLSGIPLGGMAGTIAALKMDFGESVGPWKFHDRALRVNKDQLRRSEDGNAEAVRRARRDGTPEPELMSVATDARPADHEGK